MEKESTAAAKRITIFLAGLAVIFGAAVAIGSLVEPADTESDAEHGGGHATEEGDYVLRLSPIDWARGEGRELRFSIEDAEGKSVTDFDELHERRMHLIVVRRDGAEFRHLHPEMDEAGTWSIPIEFDEAGPYRAFADFSVAGEQHTLAGDISVSGGEFEARPFPAPSAVDATNEYEVRLDSGEPAAGESSSLSFTVSRNGRPVADLDPYLGAKGHLVALREGDLAFLHVHPEEAEATGAEAEGHGAHGTHGSHGGTGAMAAEEIAFAATFPTAGRYRLYLQFRHEGAVQTAEFTVAVPR